MLSPDPNPPTTETPLRSDLVRYAAIATVVVTIAAATSAGLDLARAGTASLWVFLGVPTVLFAVAGLVRAYRDGDLDSWVRPVWGDPTRGVVSGALLVAASALVVHFVCPVGSPRESWIARIYLQVGSPLALRDHVWVVAASIVVVAAAEEIVWRGLVTTLLAEKMGTRSAWFVAAFLYAFANAPSIWALRDPVAGLNPMLFLAALGLGLVWGAMTRYMGRLMPAILSHAVFDWCVIMTFRLWGHSV